MKFLIQKIHKEIRHDFAFTLLEAIRFNDWLLDRERIAYKYLDTEYDEISKVFTKPEFKSLHATYTPIGSVEFVSEFTKHFFGFTPKPTNIPNELLKPQFLQRFVFNGTEKEITGDKFVKSNDGIKKYAQSVDDKTDVPIGNYQISDMVTIDSEWRVFVYKNTVCAIQNYCGDFTLFPDVQLIKGMITAYTHNSPIAYTLDVGVNKRASIELEIYPYNGSNNTFIIEVHDFFSCGLYGFRELSILPMMFHRSFQQLVRKNCNII